MELKREQESPGTTGGFNECAGMNLLCTPPHTHTHTMGTEEQALNEHMWNK